MAFDRITPTRFGGAEIAVSPTITTVRTTPTGCRDIVKDIDIANNGAAAVTVTVWLVPNGGTAGSSNILVPGVNINAHSSLQWTGTQVLNEGATIQANASAANVSVIASGGEVT
jgi:hypothetical protein